MVFSLNFITYLFYVFIFKNEALGKIQKLPNMKAKFIYGNTFSFRMEIIDILLRQYSKGFLSKV